MVVDLIVVVYWLQPVYNKDDFFDTLSCNSLNRGGWSGRTRLSERMKLDTEVWIHLIFLLHLKSGCFTQMNLLTAIVFTCRLLANSSRGLLWFMATMGLPILGTIGVHITEEGAMDIMVEEVLVVIDPFK